MKSKVIVLFHGPSWLYGSISAAVISTKLSAMWFLVIPIGILIDLLWARYLQSKA